MSRIAQLPTSLATLVSNPSSALLLRGSMLSFLMLGCNIGLVFLLNVASARMLGPQQYGIFAYALGVLQLVGLIPACGLDNGLLRFIPEYRATGQWSALHGLLRLSLLLTCCVAVSCGIVLALVTAMFVETALQSTFYLTACCLPAAVLISIISSGLRAMKRVGLSQFPHYVLRPVLFLFLVQLLFLLGSNWLAPHFMACYIVSLMIVLAVSLVALRHSVSAEVLESEPVYRVREWLRVSFPMAVMTAGQQLINRTDIVLVGLMVGPTEAGIYAVVTLMAKLLMFGNMATDSILAPMISELHAQGRKEELQRLVTLACRLTVPLCCLVAILMATYRYPLLNLYGSGFASGAIPLMWLLAGQVVNSATGPVGYLLICTGHHQDSMRINLYCSLLNIVVCVVAIAWLGMVGAAVATAFCISFQNLWRWWIAWRKLGVSSTLFATG